MFTEIGLMASKTRSNAVASMKTCEEYNSYGTFYIRNNTQSNMLFTIYYKYVFWFTHSRHERKWARVWLCALYSIPAIRCMRPTTSTTNSANVQENREKNIARMLPVDNMRGFPFDVRHKSRRLCSSPSNESSSHHPFALQHWTYR